MKEHYLFNDAAHTANFLFIGYKYEVSRRNIIKVVKGFVLANDKYMNKFLYVDVICSKEGNLGNMLLAEVEKFAQEKGFMGVSLASLPHVVGYYHGMGYRNRKDCADENPEVETLFQRLAFPFVLQYKREVPNYMGKEEGAQYRQFLQDLINRGIVNKGCTTQEACAIDGYIMTKCWGRPTSTARTRFV